MYVWLWTVLLLVAAQSAVFACTAAIVYRWYRHEKAALISQAAELVQEFVQSPNADTPSPLATLIDQCALLFASRLAQQLKAMISGVESGVAKGEQLALIEEAGNQNPLIALVAGILPKRLRNQLAKNPQMLGALASFGGRGNHSETHASQRGSFSL